ncbi:MAG: Secondary metabolism regulator lae1 [Cirrosporium novae-zelandiae]|nr:MAG: Secondary metabolism regulator lae1 [Cirrosporium novae-zelandiae]
MTDRIPPNLRFLIPRDYESPWYLGEDSFDLIHIRMALGGVQHWAALYQTAFRHLKPGCGILEHVEIDLQPRCDDGTLTDDLMLSRWYGWLDDATQRALHPIAYPPNIREMLQLQGFVDIEETVIRLPLNEWVINDPEQRILGRWYCLGMTHWLEALSLAPFTRVYNWPVADVHRLVKEVTDQMGRRSIHAYNNL